jgi:branched-chain amino acid transport system permease protein
MKHEMSTYDWRETIRWGLISGVVSLSVSLIGMVETFSESSIVGDVLTLGHVLLLLPPAAVAYLLTSRNERAGSIRNLLAGSLTGLLTAVPVTILIYVAGPLNLRRFFLNVSPELLNFLTFDQDKLTGALILAGLMLGLGVAGALLALLPDASRRALMWAVAVILSIGLLSEVFSLVLGTKGLVGDIREFLFPRRGLSLPGTALTFVLVAGGHLLWTWRSDAVDRYYQSMPAGQQRAVRGSALALGLIVALLIPQLLGTYLTEVLDNVGIYILMGLGLNIVVGFAGLLDLGYVAFFAIGAYTVGVLTSESSLGVAGMTFWEALPFAVMASVAAGVLLGIPVLRMRGDYLAIVTLGFGEIIRILALSDFLRPWIGGAQGILQIPKPSIAGFRLKGPEELYYLILLGCVLTAFIAWRLRDARLGRQWMAMREDEDVAEAMGINLVKTKLLAFGMGAAFAGLSGAIFASKLASIIVGGMGSLPGVFVGALVLVGLPELLREFAEYRLLMYGALLIAMMVLKPEGFWPSAVRQRELHALEERVEPGHAQLVAQPTGGETN